MINRKANTNFDHTGRHIDIGPVHFLSRSGEMHQSAATASGPDPLHEHFIQKQESGGYGAHDRVNGDPAPPIEV